VALRDLIKPHIRDLQPYEPGKPIEELERELGIEGAIKLASNESPIGPSPLAMAAVRDALDGVHRYPDGSSYALREKLSGRLEVQPEQLVFGGGRQNTFSLLELTKIVQSVTKDKVEIDRVSRQRESDIGIYISNNAFVQKETGWSPSKTVEQIVTDINDWIDKRKDLLQGVFNA